MTLRQWLDKKKMTAREFCRRAGLTEATVSRVKNGHTPKLIAARAIERATKGAVRL